MKASTNLNDIIPIEPWRDRRADARARAAADHDMRRR